MLVPSKKEVLASGGLVPSTGSAIYATIDSDTRVDSVNMKNLRSCGVQIGAYGCIVCSTCFQTVLLGCCYAGGSWMTVECD